MQVEQPFVRSAIYPRTKNSSSPYNHIKSGASLFAGNDFNKQLVLYDLINDSSSKQNPFAVIGIRDDSGWIAFLILQLAPSQDLLAANLFRVDYHPWGALGTSESCCLYLAASALLSGHKRISQKLTNESEVTRQTSNVPTSIIRYRGVQSSVNGPPEASHTAAMSKDRRTRPDVRHSILGFLGFIFSPDEVRATATSIRGVICACLLCAEKHVGKLSLIVEQKLDDFEQALDAASKIDEQASGRAVRLRRPTMAKAGTGFSQPDIQTLSKNVPSCTESVGTAAAMAQHFIIQVLRQINSLSFHGIFTRTKYLARSTLLALCRKVKVTVRSRLSKGGLALLSGLRKALLSPVTNWKIVGLLPKKRGWNVRPLDVIACILAFLVNIASALVEGNLPARVVAYDYKTSIDSSLRDPASKTAFNDIKDYLGISISTLKALQMPTDIFAEPEVPVFGWGELILRTIILTIQFPRNKTVPGYGKRVSLFACYASETIAYHLLLFLNLGHMLISSRTLAGVQLVVSMFSFMVALSMHWNDLATPNRPNLAKAKQLAYLNISGSTLGSIAGFAGKAMVIKSDPASRTFCAVLIAVANKGNAVVQTTLKVRRK